jgi:hypothetical protein
MSFEMVRGALQIAKSRLLETGSDRKAIFDKFEVTGDTKRNWPKGQVAFRETKRVRGSVQMSLAKDQNIVQATRVEVARLSVQPMDFATA